MQAIRRLGMSCIGPGHDWWIWLLGGSIDINDPSTERSLAMY